jgi:hypothetical protein
MKNFGDIKMYGATINIITDSIFIFVNIRDVGIGGMKSKKPYWILLVLRHQEGY